MLTVNNLSKRFKDKKLFENVNLKFLPGNTYGIIGANGAGKSTFLKIISNEIESSTGEINYPQDSRISVLEQDHNIYNDISATNVVVMGDKDLYKIQQEKDAIYINSDSTENDYHRASELEELYGQKGGWEAENKAQILLGALGIKKDHWTYNIKNLKNNDKIKVLLAQALFGNPDILIMDEPTNHLDLKSIKWLEEFLKNYKNIVIVVSHDSDFLDEICTYIIDIDFMKAKMFTGNYSFWKKSSQLALEMSKNQNAKKEEKIEKLKAFIARFSANASKSSQATSRRKELEKITINELVPSTRKYPFIKFELNRKPGKDILRVENLSYENKKGEILFTKISFTLKFGDKLAILGDNDIGKTALLEILMGNLKPKSGTIHWGATIKTTYFPNNNNAFFDNNQTIIEWISKWPTNNEIAENKKNDDQRMRSFLGRMLFSGNAIFKKVAITSGGEKARLMFSRMMLLESNFLVLDQPLNHLDTESIDSVIQSLKIYPSTAIFTTYNRAFVKKTSNCLLEIFPNKSFFFRGTLKEFEESMNY